MLIFGNVLSIVVVSLGKVMGVLLIILLEILRSVVGSVVGIKCDVSESEKEDGNELKKWRIVLMLVEKFWVFIRVGRFDYCMSNIGWNVVKDMLMDWLGLIWWILGWVKYVNGVWFMRIRLFYDCW